jgi:hypothetical protein
VRDNRLEVHAFGRGGEDQGREYAEEELGVLPVGEEGLQD